MALESAERFSAAPVGQGRQLVVCLDGTGNRFGDRPTNILRIVRCLSRDPARVLSYYDQGVGTFGLRETLFEWQKVPARVAGLAFGWGFDRTVEGAFRFLSQNYRAGDSIFIFGFSRGAFAARALAALIRAVGLMPPHATHQFDHAWALLRSRSGPGRQPDFTLLRRFKTTFGLPVAIDFLGLFDTVKSVGWIYDPLVLPYTVNNSAVKMVRHAVSIDERRCFFRQHLWGWRQRTRQDVKEVWFAGAHSDVGGGYVEEEAQLALLALRWMLGEAALAGLAFEPAWFTQAFRDSARFHLAPMHDALRRHWHVAEWLPRRVWNFAKERREWSIGAMSPIGRARPRAIPNGVSVHESVVARCEADIGYQPINLPKVYKVVGDNPVAPR